MYFYAKFRKMLVTKALMILAMVLIQGSLCLRVVEVVVPRYRLRGEPVLLECRFQLDRNLLYSVKWYKDNEEFYRFMPRMTPLHHSYRVDGVKVDLAHSNDKNVTLKAVTLKSSGVYRCEVNAEAPSFSSVQGEHRMEVVYLPKDGPHISGLQQQPYQTGDLLQLNCTSGRSHPAAQLHWYVNDEVVSDLDSLVQYPHVVHSHGLVTSLLGLRLRLRPLHFPAGLLRVRCQGRVSPAPHTPHNQLQLVERGPALEDNREALVLVKSAAPPISCSPLSVIFLWTALLHIAT